MGVVAGYKDSVGHLFVGACSEHTELYGLAASTLA